MGSQKTDSDLKRIIEENAEGLEKLARESTARERRDHPLISKIKKLYREHIKEPQAQPAYI